MSEKLTIDLWTDIVCPFCYIGEARLRRALEAEGMTAEIRIRSFELDPGITVPVSSIDRLVESKGVDREQVEKMEGRLQEMAAGEDLTYSTDRLTGTTMPVHILTQYATREDVAVGEQFFRAVQTAYFEGGLNPFDIDELLEFAEKQGLDRDEAAAALKNTDFIGAVRGDQEIAEKLGVQGVPYILLNQKLAVPGAVSSERFQEALRQAVQ